MELLNKGAEASIYLDNNTIFKVRTPKSYRLKKLDDELIKTRTRSEAKILVKLSSIAPRLISTNNKDKIQMEYVEGKRVVKLLDSDPSIAKEIAKSVSIMHSKNIVHGDLTTSNMILSNNKIILIDFGLSKTSQKYEDKAVDLHLLKEVLLSKHYLVKEEVWNIFLENYDVEHKSEILKRLKQVEKRGRNKKK